MPQLWVRVVAVIVFLVGLLLAALLPLVERLIGVALLLVLPLGIVAGVGVLLGLVPVAAAAGVAVGFCSLGLVRLRLQHAGYGPDDGPVQRVVGGPR